MIADHGNAEHLLQEDGSPHTAHTTNPVPVVLTAPEVTFAGRRARPTSLRRFSRLLGLNGAI